MENKNNKTFVEIYTMTGLSLTKEHINTLLSLQLKYANTKINVVSINKDIEGYNNDERLILF